MSRVPFLDLKAQYQSIKPEIEAAVLASLESTQFVLGDRVKAFEEAFAAYCGATEAVAVNSGTSALHLALAALGVGPGDEVVTVSMSFVATVAAVCYTGARAVLVDVEPDTFTLDPAKLEAAITPRTKAIIPVHLHGQMADMSPLLDIAARHGIPVVEDAAQAHGAEYQGRRAGGMGAIGCFSFYPGKNLGAYGEGGAVTTSDAKLAAKMRMLRDWGQDRKYNHLHLGFNYRMDGIQGAILGVKMNHIEAWTEARRAVARRYDEALAGLDLVRPVEKPGRRHVWHVYAIQTADRDSRIAELEAAGVSTGIHYPVPIHLQPGYAQLGYRAGDFPVSERLAAGMLSLPMFPEMTDRQIDRVVAALKRA